MKRILVTGGMGMLGFNLCKLLSQDSKNEVIGTYNNNYRVNTPCSFVSADLTDPMACDVVTRNVDEIYMCASKSYGAYMMNKDPKLLVTENVVMNAQLLDAAAKNNVKKILFVSSSTVYPNSDSKMKEGDSNGCLYHLYEGVGGMKRYVESLLKFYSYNYNIKFVIVRPANMYGPYDKFDDEHSHVIPALIKRALNHEDPFVVWGTGKNVRDFIYVEDAARMMIALMNKYCDNRIINIGSSEGIKLKEIVQKIISIVGYKPKIIYDSSKPDAIPYRVLNITQQIFTLPNYSLTSMDVGLKKTMEWYNENKR